MFSYATCRKLKGKVEVQIMAGLPKDRFEEAAPFTRIAKRENVGQIRPHNGSNFDGAEHELLTAFTEVDHTKM